MRPLEIRDWVTSERFLRRLIAAYEEHGAARPETAPPEITYARYKPGVSCLVGLALRTEEGAIARGYLKIFLAGGAAECHAKYAVRTRGGGWSALLAPEDTVYFHFPLDRAVRGLPWIIAPSGLKHSVQEAEGAGDALRGARLRKSRTSLDVLKYKPERRAIVVADAETVNEATGEGGRLRMVARAYGEYEATSGTIAALLRRLGDAASRGDISGDVPRPIGAHAARRLLFHEWVDGVALDDSLRRGDGLEACSLAGAFLRSLSSFPADGLPVRSIPDLVGAAATMASDISAAEPRLAAPAASAAEAIARGAASLRSVRPQLLHGDFYHHQILVHPGRVTVLDWDEACAGDPLIDAANFVAHLRLAELDGELPPGIAAAARDRFLAGRFEGHPPPPDFTVYRSFQLLRLATAPLRQLSPDWAARAKRILEEVPAWFGRRGAAVAC